MEQRVTDDILILALIDCGDYISYKNKEMFI